MLSSLIVGAGCFWGVEVLYEQMPGVINATSGYSGGHLDNPRYEDVLTGETGHVEVVKIDYDSSEVTFNELIDTFFIIHDPTTCLLYTSPSPRDATLSRMPSSA